MKLSGSLKVWAFALLVFLLSACSTPSTTASSTPSFRSSPSSRLPPAAALDQWQGRLSVTVQSDPPQSSSASFQLQGNAAAGELQFFSPLGTTLAKLQWQGAQVHLHRGQDPERFASMDELTEQLTGSALPVAALLDWLQGKPHAVAGWQADLSALSEGTLTAQRRAPMPAVTLRVKLD